MAAKPSLEELLKGVDPSRLSQPCRDHHLSEVALHITEWRSIAPFLRLKEVDEDQIVTKFPSDLRAQKIAMLRRWREKRGGKATYQELAKVFWKLDKLSLVEEVRNVLVSECSSSESEGESEQGCVRDSGSQRWNVPRYASYLKGRYRTTRPPVLSLQWPPPPTYTVFNLALIKKKERFEHGPKEELVRLLQRGQVKEATESHTEIELSNLMGDDNQKRKVVLIEGAPGSGKSTLAWHICEQWEKGKLFTEYEVVVFVQLRDQELQTASSVAKILPVECTDHAPDIAAMLTRSDRWGRGVLLVLDGWDELQSDCPAQSFLLQLIQNPCNVNMHFSSLIITSRPASSGELQRHASSRIEVLGFKPEQVQEYFKACFGQDNELYTKFVVQLKERPVIEASCFLPLNAAIVVYLFHACKYSLPHTLFGVFEELVLSHIVRHFSARCSTKVDITASHLQDVHPDIEKPLLALSALAFDGICINKLVFSEEDITDFKLSADPSTTLSLLQEIDMFTLHRRSKSYNFFHLQIQELLAAYHISKLEEDEQVRIFKDLFGQPQFEGVFLFYSAFTKLKAEGVREILMVITKWARTYDFILQCLYEAQDPVLCQFLGLTLHTVETRCPLLVLSSRSSPLHIIALAYFLCNYCHFCNKEVSVLLENVNIVTVQRLVERFSYHHQLVVTSIPSQHHDFGSLTFVIKVSDDRNLSTLSQCVTQLLQSFQPYTKGLVFNIGSTGFSTLNIQSETRSALNIQSETRSAIVAESLRISCELVPHLQHFELHYSNGSDLVSIDESDLLTFLQSLRVNNHLRSFKLRSVKLHISQQAVELAFRVFAAKRAIECLILRNCRFALRDSAEQPFSATLFSNTLRVIDLTGTPLGGYLSAVLKGLSSNASVEELILENSDLDLTGVNGLELAHMLKTNSVLRVLNLHGGIVMDMLSQCYVGYTHIVDLQSICDGLTSNTSLACLDLTMCQLVTTEKSGSALAHMLQTNKTLKSLKLDHNPGISNEGAVYLAQGLAQNRGLETLSIVRCGISTSIVELAETIKANNCLRSLDISGNDVGERFVNIVRSLEVNSILQDLRASECCIPAQAVQRFEVRSPLEFLDLSHNPIGDEGAEHIAQLVRKCYSLFQLELRQCGIGDRGVECLASALEVNTVLEKFHFSRNTFTDDGLLTLGKSLKRNRALKLLNVHQESQTGKRDGNTTLSGEKEFVLSFCENEHVPDLCVTHAEEMNNEVKQINQIRQEKNCSVLKVLHPLNVMKTFSPHVRYTNVILGYMKFYQEWRSSKRPEK